jgi:hypothetical protein
MCNPSAEFSELTCAMRQYLVIDNRRAGEIIRHRRFQGAATALAARFRAEREFREQPDVEIVVLGAASWDALKEDTLAVLQACSGAGRSGVGARSQLSLISGMADPPFSLASSVDVRFAACAPGLASGLALAVRPLGRQKQAPREASLGARGRWITRSRSGPVTLHRG